MAFLDGYLQNIYNRAPQSGFNPPRPPSGYMPVQPPSGLQPFLPPGTPNPGANGWQPNAPTPQQPGWQPNAPTPITMPGNPPPLRGGDNPYYNGSTGQRGTGYDTDLSEKAGKLNPQAEVTRMLARNGMGGNNRLGQFAANQGNKLLGAYEAAQLDNTALNIRDFLGQGGGQANNIMDQWRGASAGQRGLNNASRSSVVRWG